MVEAAAAFGIKKHSGTSRATTVLHVGDDGPGRPEARTGGALFVGSAAHVKRGAAKAVASILATKRTRQLSLRGNPMTRVKTKAPKCGELSTIEGANKSKAIRTSSNAIARPNGCG